MPNCHFDQREKSEGFIVTDQERTGRDLSLRKYHHEKAKHNNISNQL
ncbi:hypothetical protein [Pontibacter pudoricolor]|nr:hypothetical protein [Pontibacter pudoricolor]